MLMRKFYTLLFMLFVGVAVLAQSRNDSQLVRGAGADTAVVNRFINLSLDIRKTNIDKAVDYATLALEAARGIAYRQGESQALASLGYLETQRGNHTKAAQWYRALGELDVFGGPEGEGGGGMAEDGSATEAATMRRSIPEKKEDNIKIKPVGKPLQTASSENHVTKNKPPKNDTANQALLSWNNERDWQQRVLVTEKERARIRYALLQSQRGYLWLLLLVVLLLAGLLYYFYRLRRKRIAARPQRIAETDVVAMMESEEAGRQQLAGKVQDTMGQIMAAMKMHLAALATSFTPKEKHEQETLDKTLQLVDASFEQVKNIAAISLPVSLETQGLPFAVDVLLHTKGMEQIAAGLYADGWEQRPALAVEQQLYRMVAEIVQLVRSRPGVSRVDVSLLKDVEGMSITVEDDGAEMPEEVIAQQLKTVAARAAMLGGTMDVDAAKGLLVVINVGARSYTI
jgi:signal transduction histidine kinase